MFVESVVIVGSGPAGWTAAIYAARANLRPLVFEGAVTEDNRIKGTQPLGQLNLTTEVENFPTWPAASSDAFGAFAKSALSPERYDQISFWYEGKHAHAGKRAITGPEMMQFARQQAENFGTRVVTDDIVRVDFSKRPFTLFPSDGDPVQARTVIIATGARANYLGLPSEEMYKNNGVSACAVCDGALPRFRNRPLVVVGGGDSAVEEGTYLTKFGSIVYLVHRRDQLRASKIMQQRLFNNPKIHMLANTAVQEVLGNDEDGVTGVRLRPDVDIRMPDGSFKRFTEWLKERDQSESLAEVLPVAGMFCAIGHTPNTDFLKGSGVKLDDKGYIIWTKPQRTHTSVEGVFAAGDVADNHYRQAITAAGTGCMAALDAERWLAEHE